MGKEKDLLATLGIQPERALQNRDDADISLTALAYQGDISRHPSFAGTIYSNKMGMTIPVLRKQNETSSQAIKRVSARHN